MICEWRVEAYVSLQTCPRFKIYVELFDRRPFSFALLSKDLQRQFRAALTAKREMEVIFIDEEISDGKYFNAIMRHECTSMTKIPFQSRRLFTFSI